MKGLIFLVMFCLVEVSNADIIDQYGVVRNSDDTIHYMNFYEATKACPPGTHMPTVREFTTEAHALGRNAVLEMTQVDPNAIPDNYFKFSVVDPDGKKDEFYYNSAEGTYARPQDLSLWNLVAWSSSVAAIGTTEGYSFNYANGSFFGVSLEYNNEAVRCVSSTPQTLGAYE